MSFANMKANRAKTLESLEQKLNDTGNRPNDDRYWAPTRDQAGNGSAIIRLLPPTDGEDLPYVKLWSHAFKGPTGLWYIENSRTTLSGSPDPVSEHNQKLWATDTAENKKLVSQRKRQLRYIANIYVVKDPAKPENDGKVFLYKFGQKIMDKINAAWKPEFDDQEPVVPFDFWEGANLRLRIQMVANFPNYDGSTFDRPGPLFAKGVDTDGNPQADDKKIEAVWNTQYKLQDEVAADKFKPYDELKARFLQVIGSVPASEASTEEAEDLQEEREVAPAPRARATPATKSSSKKEALPTHAESDDDDMSWFKDMEKTLDE